MNPAGKALWYVENHFGEELSLDDVADAAGVTRYHLSRVFGIAFGHSVMGYVRGRRLTEAARMLAGGANDILAVALEAGYGSHEAFTRAFGEQFGMTPEALRARGNLDNISLTEPIKMDESLDLQLEAPRFETLKTLLIAGVGQHYTAETSAGIPAQWQKIVPYLGSIPGQVGWTTYGVVCQTDDAGNTEYVCGVEVSDFTKVQPELRRLRIPDQSYAVFAHRGHVSTVRRTWHTIWNKWLPESGYRVAEAPELERYGKEFDPRSGNGGFEIWIPVKSKENGTGQR